LARPGRVRAASRCRGLGRGRRRYHDGPFTASGS
jgi:hypothetical protein